MQPKISGTGKTLSLLCATLGWISKQTEIKNEWTPMLVDGKNDDNQNENKIDVFSDADMHMIIDMPDVEIPMEKVPQVIYASRTHSQISQGKRFILNRFSATKIHFTN